jgi:hypothetical protein
MTKWDEFLAGNPNVLNLTEEPLVSREVTYKSLNKLSTNLHRETCQMLDVSLYHVQTLQFCPRSLVLATMFISLGLRF